LDCPWGSGHAAANIVKKKGGGGEEMGKYRPEKGRGGKGREKTSFSGGIHWKKKTGQDDVAGKWGKKGKKAGG